MTNIYISGLTGAFDTESMINTLMNIKQQPITALAKQKALIQTKISTLNNLYGALSGMKSFINSLDVDKIFSTKKATSSNINVLSVEATKDTPNLTMTLTVTKLAQTEMRASTKGMSSLTSSFFSSSGTMSLKYWISDSEAVSYNINYSANQTLQDLVNSINSAQNYVKASVYYTGTDYRLLLTEADVTKSTKETATGYYVIEIETLPVELYDPQIGMLEILQNAQNASLKVGNSPTEIISSSNTFRNLVDGLDVTVKATGSATVSITEDYSQVDATLNSFVSNYNSVVSLINQITAKGAQFQGEITITTIKSNFSMMINPLINLGLINYSDKDGAISLNTDVINDLKSSNPEKLKEAISKLKDSFGAQLNTWTISINAYKNMGEEQINRINQRIASMEEALVGYERRLRKEFAHLEAFINQMNQISLRLKDFITTLSEMTGGNKK